MNLIEIKILYRTDLELETVINTQEHIQELLYWVSQRPDIIHVSKTVIPDGADDDNN